MDFREDRPQAFVGGLARCWLSARDIASSLTASLSQGPSSEHQQHASIQRFGQIRQKSGPQDATERNQASRRPTATRILLETRTRLAVSPPDILSVDGRLEQWRVYVRVYNEEIDARREQPSHRAAGLFLLR